MTWGKKTGGRDFKKGQSGNPKGKPKLTEEIKALRALTAVQIKEVSDLILMGNVDGLREIINTNDSSVLRIWLAKAAIEGIKKGNLGPLETILNRTVGKPKETISIEGSAHALLVKMIHDNSGEE